MLKSMTGFGRASADYNDFSITIDVSSVNKKGLEVYVSVLRDWVPMERMINAELKKFFSRGKFNISVSVDFKRGAEDLFASGEAIESAMKTLKDLCLKNVKISTLHKGIASELCGKTKKEEARRACVIRPPCKSDRKRMGVGKNGGLQQKRSRLRGNGWQSWNGAWCALSRGAHRTMSH